MIPVILIDRTSVKNFLGPLSKGGDFYAANSDSMPHTDRY